MSHGSPLDPDAIETVAMGAAPPPRAATGERFPPGMLLASRYRIVSRLGKGGMGEVFRADDIVLGQPVALKFLPPQAQGNVNLLKRFYDEVRIARQISHRNVCRVYDIGEVEGQPYLSMEYIDGEDLGSLLRRIGRLPGDKAIEFARKLCAGVSAAHAQGVLHRDIKPGNIMIDSRGELRITDFGLAGLADHLQGAEIRNGTPAYMAPEQLAGREVSAQSDLYAVGLVLYEMFTGKLPFQADTVAEIRRIREESRLTNPSTLVADIDKTVERAILRCLDPDPKQRPPSALALAASLPGGDPLAAALAEGETPSPELVAASGSAEGLAPKYAVAALAAFFLILGGVMYVAPRQYLINRSPLEYPPDVLTAKARDIAKSLGYTAKPADSANGFYANGAYMSFVRENAKGQQVDWSRVIQQAPSPLGFWYRESPRPLLTQDDSAGTVTVDSPPLTVPGMLLVNIDPEGRLRRFFAAPPDHEPDPVPAKPVDWSPLFAAAKIDPASLTSATPEWTPMAVTDTRAAWTGTYPGRPEIPIRIEASAFHGKVVSFDIVWPWGNPSRTPAPQNSVSLFSAGAVIFFMAIAAAIARYNWRAGRADTHGALRVGIYVAVASLIVWVLRAHHVGLGGGESELLGTAFANATFMLAMFWLIYLALEPWIRRYWPQALITWSRLMAGRWRDPSVGRDLLWGSLCGIVYAAFIQAFIAVSTSLNDPSFLQNAATVAGVRSSLVIVAQLLTGALTGALQLFLLLFVFRLIVRKTWIAAILFVLLTSMPDRFSEWGDQEPAVWWLNVGMFLIIYAVLALIMVRLGFFALMVTLFTINSTSVLFLTTDFGAWYGQGSWIVTVAVSAIALWGFKLALAGRPIFGPAAARS